MGRRYTYIYVVFFNVLETDLCLLFVPLRYSGCLDFCGLFSLFIMCVLGELGKLGCFAVVLLS